MLVIVIVIPVSQWMKLSLDDSGISTGARAVVELRDSHRMLCIVSLRAICQSAQNCIYLFLKSTRICRLSAVLTVECTLN